MELKVIDVQLPEQISFNYEELKAELMAKVSVYENMVYSGEEEIKSAKVDRANLNKLKKALNDERIRREKEYMQPLNDFKAKINEIIQIIDKPVLMIDSQVKAFEEQQKAEKLEQIKEYFSNHPSIEGFDTLQLEQIFNEKWLNASVNMKTVQTEIDAKMGQIMTDLETLRNLPEFGFEAVEEYKQSLDLNKAIAEGHRLSEIQKRKAEEIARMERAAIKPTPNTAVPTEAVEPQAEPQKDWVSFKALLSTEDALALKEFFDSRNIEFKAI